MANYLQEQQIELLFEERLVYQRQIRELEDQVQVLTDKNNKVNEKN